MKLPEQHKIRKITAICDPGSEDETNILKSLEETYGPILARVNCLEGVIVLVEDQNFDLAVRN